MALKVIGVDVSKDTLDVALIEIGGALETIQVPNISAGFVELANWITQHDGAKSNVYLEATGTYSNMIARTLHEHGHRIALLNPLQAKRFSEVQLKRTNTDKVDAVLLAKFGLAVETHEWKPLPPEVRELRQLFSLRKALVQDKIANKNRRAAPDLASSVCDLLDKRIDTICTENY